MILNDEQITSLIDDYNQEHKQQKKNLINQAIWAKEHITLMEIYSLPFKDRQYVSESLKEYYDEVNKGL